MAHAVTITLTLLAGASAFHDTTFEIQGEASLVRRAASIQKHDIERNQPKRFDPLHPFASAFGSSQNGEGEGEEEATNQTNHNAGDVGTAPRQHLDRSNLSHSFIEEKIAGACSTHYKEFQDITSNADCAQKCYETFGCTRFSYGGCALGCRVSFAGENAGADTAPNDGKCHTTAAGDHGKCIVYRLAFFHATDGIGACNTHYERITDAASKADCAHACKNTAGCTKFTTSPNCNGGCRISKCGKNHGGTADSCPADKQCTMTTTQGCTVYKLFR